jgi:Icc-related predicted phosphoesterase
MPRIIVISDTHNYHENIVLPKGDILIHCGDATNSGKLTETNVFAKWFQSTQYQMKIFVPGNHDWLFQRDHLLAREMFETDSCKLLIDQSIEFMGIKFYGAPWQPEFYSWAFNLPRGERLKEKWDLIPSNVDVLITHGPPIGKLDSVDSVGRRASNLGCADLMDAVNRIKPRAHCFGHIHDGYGTLDQNGTKFINASICTERYIPRNKPIILDI